MGVLLVSVADAGSGAPPADAGCVTAAALT
ncbi:hypothetical protein MKAN_02720 [Mycobacterium kansasii ATCC 12478]|uniref:Uncharacterized protein n=1 Tax=Mycobacterium kansasii ATCC 12478 TaxID=557599 RepID=U5X1A9_MYCKA|nr:hypothetical protein MKAN_02720 [Mycobacterium kansasii ATCC 12478]